MGAAHTSLLGTSHTSARSQAASPNGTTALVLAGPTVVERPEITTPAKCGIGCILKDVRRAATTRPIPWLAALSRKPWQTWPSIAPRLASVQLGSPAPKTPWQAIAEIGRLVDLHVGVLPASSRLFSFGPPLGVAVDITVGGRPTEGPRHMASAASAPRAYIRAISGRLSSLAVVARPITVRGLADAKGARLLQQGPPPMRLPTWLT